MNGGERITNWEWPETKLHSQYGFITFREWCEREVARAAAAGRTFAIRVGETLHRGEICLEVAA